MKRAVSTAILRLLFPSMKRDRNSLNRLLADAVRLQCGRLDDDAFRKGIDAYYSSVDRNELIALLQLESKKSRLDRPNGYKVDVVALADDATRRGMWQNSPMWKRRFGLLRHLGVRMDVLILRDGSQIPPHGHYGVVSGFYVLEGEVAFRHYDRVREAGDSVYVRKCVDMIARPGEFATNSEYYQNIHWLCGMSPKSYLFRITVVGTPAKTFGSRKEKSERVYVDPSGNADDNGLILAPYITHDQANTMSFYEPTVLAVSA